MSEQDVRVQTSDGAMTTFVAHPDEGGPFPVVVVFMDALGLRDELRELGRKIAEAGYFAAVPDLYYRFGDGVVFEASKLHDPESGEMQRMFETMQKVTDDMAMADTRAVLDEVADASLASEGPKGAVGFCWGGRLVVRAMATFPDQFRAGSALHPSFIVAEGPSSCHLDIHKLQGELYVGLGGSDQFQPPAAFEPARTELEQHGVPHTIETHEGADHGFMIPGAPAYQEHASERSWEQTFELFGRTLGRTPAAVS
jgi:carboxymethylenebutenolidase